MSAVKQAGQEMFRGPAGRELLRLAHRDPEVGHAARTVIKMAIGWDSLPKGWTQDSVEKFWGSLTGAAKHKVTKCMEKMKGRFDDPGAFCASLADTVEGSTDWRKKEASQRLASRWLNRRANATLPIVLQKYQVLKDKLEQTLSEMLALGKDADKEFDRLEDLYASGQKTWEQAGNHADDWNSSPEGELAWDLMHIAEDLAKDIGARDNSRESSVRILGSLVHEMDQAVHNWRKKVK